MINLARMDQKGALPYLEEYLKSYPDDEFAKTLASSIKEGTLKIEHWLSSFSPFFARSKRSSVSRILLFVF